MVQVMNAGPGRSVAGEPVRYEPMRNSRREKARRRPEPNSAAPSSASRLTPAPVRARAPGRPLDEDVEAGVADRLAAAVGWAALAPARTVGEAAVLVVAETCPAGAGAAAGAGPVTFPSAASDSPAGRLMPERSMPGAMALMRASTP